MAFALLFCSILVLLPDREKTRRERKPYNNVNRLLLEKKPCENLFIRQIKCTFAIDMVTEAKGITII